MRGYNPSLSCHRLALLQASTWKQRNSMRCVVSYCLPAIRCEMFVCCVCLYVLYILCEKQPKFIYIGKLPAMGWVYIGDHRWRKGVMGKQKDINWGAFDHASHSPQYESYNYYIIYICAVTSQSIKGPACCIHCENHCLPAMYTCGGGICSYTAWECIAQAT